MEIIERFNQLRVQLPKRFNEIDKIWITETLKGLSFKERQKAIIKYSEIYQEAFELEELSYKKQNVAGRAANSRLREYAKKCLNKKNEKVSRPPILVAE